MKEAYAVKDVKAGSFGTPMFLAAEGIAMRGFIDAAMDPQSPIGAHPSDYELYMIGTYDENSALLEGTEVTFLVNGVQAIAMGRRERAKMNPELPLEQKEVEEEKEPEECKA